MESCSNCWFRSAEAQKFGYIKCYNYGGCGEPCPSYIPLEEKKIPDISKEVLELSENDEFWKEEEEAERDFVKFQEEAYSKHN